MPRQTIVQLTDDYDGKALPDDTSPVTLSLGRTTYNLYLSEDNHGKLLELLNPFIEDAETVSSSSRTAAPSKAASSGNKEDQKNARHWAQTSGFKFKDAQGNEKTLGDRGRIPDAVLDGWKAAGSPVMGSEDK